MRRTSIYTILIICLGFVLKTHGKFASAHSESFRYIGRFDFSNPQSPSFAHSGTHIEFLFKGTQLEIGLSNDVLPNIEDLNYYTVLKNGQKIATIKPSKIKAFFSVNIHTPDTFCRIQVIKRTESFCGIGVFHGVKYNEEGALQRPPKKLRKIEWIGDSFLAGYGNMVAIDPPPKDNPSTGFHAENEDAYQTFGVITSRNLHADYSCIAMSGKGVYRNYDTTEEETVPKIYPFIYPDGGKYDFLFKPDLIVIKLGTNDFGAEMNQPPNMTDSSRFVSTYLKFLHDVINNNPTSKIVLALGGGISNSFPKGLNRLKRYRNWVQKVKIEAEQKYMNEFGFFEFKLMEPPYGEDWHPTVNDQNKFAKEITPFLKKFMGW